MATCDGPFAAAGRGAHSGAWPGPGTLAQIALQVPWRRGRAFGLWPGFVSCCAAVASAAGAMAPAALSSRMLVAWSSGRGAAWASSVSCPDVGPCCAPQSSLEVPDWLPWLRVGRSLQYRWLDPAGSSLDMMGLLPRLLCLEGQVHGAGCPRTAGVNQVQSYTLQVEGPLQKQIQALISLLSRWQRRPPGGVP
jgi:hypothetical protein